MMKNLIGFSGKTGEGLDKLEVMLDGEDNVTEALDLDPYENTLGDYFFRLFEAAFGIPEAMFHKKLIDLSARDIELLDQLDEDSVRYRMVD